MVSSASLGESSLQRKLWPSAGITPQALEDPRGDQAHGDPFRLPAAGQRRPARDLAADRPQRARPVVQCQQLRVQHLQLGETDARRS